MLRELERDRTPISFCVQGSHVQKLDRFMNSMSNNSTMRHFLMNSHLLLLRGKPFRSLLLAYGVERETLGTWRIHS